MRILNFKKCILSREMSSLRHEVSYNKRLRTFKHFECSIKTVVNRRPHCFHSHQGSCSGIDPVVSLELPVNDENTDTTEPSVCSFRHSSIHGCMKNGLIRTNPLHSVFPNSNQHFYGKLTNNFSRLVVRNFCSNFDENNRVKVKPVFVAVPNPIRAIRNFVYSWLIRGYFDKDFSMAEFTEGAKQAMSVVSQKISEGNFEELVGLLSQKTIDEVKTTYKTLGVKERGSLGIELEDILHVVPYNVAVHYDKSGGKFLNILMRYWCLSLNSDSENDPGVIGFKVGQPPPGMSEEQFKNMGKVFTCTFEFHRDVSTNDDPNWTITQVTLGKLLNTSSDGFPGEELE